MCQYQRQTAEADRTHAVVTKCWYLYKHTARSGLMNIIMIVQCHHTTRQHNLSVVLVYIGSDLAEYNKIEYFHMIKDLLATD